MAAKPTGERFHEVLAATVRARGLEPLDLVRAVPSTSAEITNWLLGDTVPTPSAVFRLEEILDVHAGSISRLLGYLPLGPVAAGISVEDVVTRSQLIDGDSKRVVLAVWEELLKRQHCTGTAAIRTGGSRAVGPRARRRPGLALVEYKRDFQGDLRALGRAESTIRNHLAAVEQFYRFLCRQGRPGTDLEVTREDVERYLEEVGVRGSNAAVANRYRSLKQFFQWLVDEGDLLRSPMAFMTAPHSNTS